MRIFKKTRLKTLIFARRLCAHNPRQQTDNRVQQGQCRWLPTRQNEISEAHLFQTTSFNHPLINTFKSPAQKDDPGARRKLPHPLLGQGAPARA